METAQQRHSQGRAETSARIPEKPRILVFLGSFDFAPAETRAHPLPLDGHTALGPGDRRMGGPSCRRLVNLVSVAMRKSPLVARRKSPLVAKQQSAFLRSCRAGA